MNALPADLHQRQLCSPARPSRSGATLTGEGVNFAVYSSGATQSGAVPVRCNRRARAAARLRCRSAPRMSGMAFCQRRMACRGRLWLSCARPVDPAYGLRYNPTSCCSIRMRARSPAIRLESTRCSATTADPDERASPSPADSAPFNYKARVIDGAVRLGRRPSAGRAVARHGHLRIARQGIHQAASARARARARHVSGPRASRCHRSSEAPGHHRGRAAAGAGVRAGAVSGRARAW